MGSAAVVGAPGAGVPVVAEPPRSWSARASVNAQPSEGNRLHTQSCSPEGGCAERDHPTVAVAQDEESLLGLAHAAERLQRVGAGVHLASRERIEKSAHVIQPVELSDRTRSNVN